MKRLALLLLALVMPSSALAQTKVAVIVASQAAIGAAGAVDQYWMPALRLLDRAGIQYDVYDCANRTYGESGEADSTWFRERYGAVLIPYFQKNNSTASVWRTGFRDEAAATTWDTSPVNGKWSMPVYGMNSVFGFRPNAMSVGTSDSLRIGSITWGTLASGGSRSVDTLAVSGQPFFGTWLYRSVSRLAGGTDTLYAKSPYIIPLSPAFGSQVAAITWMDTTLTAFGQPSATDTLATTWRYRPLSTKPGIVWTSLECVITASNVKVSGPLVLIELMLRESTVRAAHKLPMSFTIHHAQPDRTPTATIDGLIIAQLRALKEAGLYTHFAMKVAPSEWNSLGQGGTTDGKLAVRQHLLDGWADWHVHSHATDYDGNETDSVIFRPLFNSMINTAVHPDSFYLPYSRYSPGRAVPANDVMTNAAARVYSDGGMRILEVVLDGQTTGADRYSLGRYSGYKLENAVGSTTRFLLVKSFDAGFQVDLTTFNSGASTSYRIYQTTMYAVESAVYTGGSIYWHMDLLVAPTGDNASTWMYRSVFGAWMRQFSNTLENERGPFKFGSPPVRTTSTSITGTPR